MKKSFLDIFNNTIGSVKKVGIIFWIIMAMSGAHILFTTSLDDISYETNTIGDSYLDDIAIEDMTDEEFEEFLSYSLFNTYDENQIDNISFAVGELQVNEDFLEDIDFSETLDVKNAIISLIIILVVFLIISIVISIVAIIIQYLITGFAIGNISDRKIDFSKNMLSSVVISGLVTAFSITLLVVSIIGAFIVAVSSNILLGLAILLAGVIIPSVLGVRLGSCSYIALTRDKLSLSELVKESWNLTSGNFFRTIGYGILLGIIFGTAGFSIGFVSEFTPIIFSAILLCLFNAVCTGFGLLFNLNMYMAFDEEKNTSLSA